MSLSKRFRDAVKVVQFMNAFDAVEENSILKTEIFTCNHNDGHGSRSYRWAEMEQTDEGDYKITQHNAVSDQSGLSSSGAAISIHNIIVTDPADENKNSFGAVEALSILSDLEKQWGDEGFVKSKFQPFAQQNFRNTRSNGLHC